MRKILLLVPIIGIICTFSDVYAKTTPKDAMAFFTQYTNYANSYNDKLLNMYSPDAKIIREVVKPTGETIDVVVPTKRFFKELKIGQKTARLRKYKNSYRNIIAQETPDGIKISAERQPSKENYWLKMYQIVQDTESGIVIKEEMMQTKVQTFLKHKNEGER